MLDAPKSAFEYYVDLVEKMDDATRCTYADAALLSRLLDNSDVPVRRRDLVQVMSELGEDSDAKKLRLRADRAINRLARDEVIRTMGKGVGAYWVLKDSELSDAVWLERAKEGGRPTLAPPRTPPEAYVVIIKHPSP